MLLYYCSNSTKLSNPSPDQLTLCQNPSLPLTHTQRLTSRSVAVFVPPNIDLRFLRAARMRCTELLLRDVEADTARLFPRLVSITYLRTNFEPIFFAFTKLRRRAGDKVRDLFWRDKYACNVWFFLLRIWNNGFCRMCSKPSSQEGSSVSSSSGMDSISFHSYSSSDW